MKTSLPAAAIRKVAASLSRAHRAAVPLYPGETGQRQPVHAVYGGAHLFKADIASRLGNAALRTLKEYAPDSFTFARAIGLPGARDLSGTSTQADDLEARLGSHAEAVHPENRAAWLAHAVYSRVRSKLEREPVEDFHIDFEDGYGNRPSAEEDFHAIAAAEEVARGMASGQLPAFLGIRVKPLSEELRERSIRTLDLFVTTLLDRTRGKLPGNFFVTLPKITAPEQVRALAKVFELLEARTHLRRGTLKMELMIETTQSILNGRGECSLPRLVEAAGGRCVAAHFGTYDYTASCGITAAHQQMTHPACDFAKNMMQVALAGTGVWLSDGATNILPVPLHRAAKGGSPLTQQQAEENRAAIHRAWKLHYEHVRHSLVTGFYQGWDIHPAQLPARYAAVYAFFLEGLDAASERLRNFVGKTAQATLVGEVLDDAATGQGLLNYFLRAVHCGALPEDEAQALSGLTLAELRSGSFLKILQNRGKEN